jgi:acetyl-CoA/propionyl-CoA carboxylase biotin carboxyl carrier protein
MFDSDLVANRGEIAVRVIRTLNRLGIRSIAVYSDADADSPHVGLADEAVRIGAAAPAESYLSIARVVRAAVEVGAQAIHPGYGFLSENPDFARACTAEGITFVGPPPEATELLGDKVRAKLAAEKAGVPVLPGLQRPGLTDAEIQRFAAEPDRFPLMVKAMTGFGDESLLVERYVERARHIEVQLLADAHGAVIHLGERECSLQRRHQKVLEESPSPAVGGELRQRLGRAATDIARGAGYIGAGTAEFLVPFEDPEAFAFLEVNARLQVEHPVTEAVTGLDLVEEQLRIAAGERLLIAQDDVSLTGHSIEVRVCAEDAAAGFLPATGEIVCYREPRGPGVRVDSGVRLGSVVGGSYDSLLLKVIATGDDREESLERLLRALRDLRLLGVTTNIGYLARLIAAPEVRNGELDTGLLERGVADPLPAPAESREAAIAAAAIEALALAERDAGGDPWESLSGWRLTGDAGVEWELEPTGGTEPISVLVLGEPAAATVRTDGQELRMSASDAGEGRVRVELAGHGRLWDHAVLGDERWVAAGADSFSYRLAELVVEGAAVSGGGGLEAPMPGSVLSVRVAAGDEVREGDVLVVVESMKMELTLTAPRDATVNEVRVAEGDQVTQGQPLVDLEEVSG